MLKKRLCQCLSAAGLALAFAACKTPELVVKNESRNVPASYFPATSIATPDSSTGQRPWKQFFTDANLQALIETALQNNQELNITLQEIEIARNEVRIRKGEYLPFVGLGARADVEKVGKYTLQGATEENVQIREGRPTPDPLTNFQLGAFATWEVDIWHKLRTARKAAAVRYLATVEGKNFMVTNLIAEVANSYYELLALDNQLVIVQQNIGIQRNALELVKLQKESARTTELAVKRFEAQVQHTRALQFKLQQRIVETENRLIRRRRDRDELSRHAPFRVWSDCLRVVDLFDDQQPVHGLFVYDVWAVYPSDTQLDRAKHRGRRHARALCEVPIVKRAHRYFPQRRDLGERRDVLRVLHRHLPLLHERRPRFAALEII